LRKEREEKEKKNRKKKEEKNTLLAGMKRSFNSMSIDLFENVRNQKVNK